MILYTGSVTSWRNLRRSFKLLSDDPRSWAQFAKAWRYRLDKNALRFTKQTIKALPAQPDPAARNLVFFAHFDPNDRVDPYVVYYVRALKELGSEVIFVSGSPKLSLESAAALVPFCAGIFTQATLAMDFGSWNLAWQHMRRTGWSLQRFERLILANDSVYGPLFPLHEMLTACGDADLFGATESLEIEPHVQSYFLAFTLNARTREFVNSFWKDFQYVIEKQNLIERYELGLSSRARRAALRVASYISNAAVQDALRAQPDHQFQQEVLGRNVNNTLYLWDLLISQFRFPFLKTDLPKNNRYSSRLLEDLPRFLSQYTDYPPELILNHLSSLRSRK